MIAQRLRAISVAAEQHCVTFTTAQLHKQFLLLRNDIEKLSRLHNQIISMITQRYRAIFMTAQRL